jgi:hypothetical protein
MLLLLLEELYRNYIRMLYACVYLGVGEGLKMG